MGRWMSWALLAVRIISEQLGLVQPYIAHGIPGRDMRLERDCLIRSSGFMLWALGAKEGS